MKDPENRPKFPDNRHLWYRRSLDLEQAPASAIIHVASIGYHELSINGEKADDRVLAPSLIWTFLANTTEGFTADCPHRKRMGYGEVAFATSWGIGLPNFKSGAFYTKVVRDWADVQEDNGWIHHTAPQINRHYGGPMWSSAGLNVSYETYLHYGDLRILEANYSSAKKWLEFLNQHVKDGLLCSYNKHWGKFLGDCFAFAVSGLFYTKDSSHGFLISTL